ncbi:holo-[acyl-carrier-protein] synthase [Lacrimispora amygdalina]|uniref:Holo-[acyl-carrier-protein] synthase n=1 Tax=Lacrimispora amygdalina TaxID=253257 RepID=A0A3E2NEG1_9FIRM|nr:holo-ACP synthase [Clostridium indicum]RFZ79407.1 holo-[acyl-carrier-protein] synthase [Clostridium indicum]
MIIGIGTDILNIHNIENAVKDRNDPFVQKTYTKKELELILNRPVPLNSFATRFAGKEAVFKALCVHPDAVRLNEIEILENENGQPVVFLHGKAKKLAVDKGIKTALISLSYDTDYAIAYAALSQ